MAFDEIEQPKHPGGRPPGSSEYKPEYDEMVIAWGKQGKSRAWIADELGVVRNTLKNWEAAYPSFLTAMERAQTAAQRWWEEAGQNGMFTREFNAPIWSRSMAARFPDDWRESKDMNLNGTLNITEIKRTIVDPRNSDT